MSDGFDYPKGGYKVIEVDKLPDHTTRGFRLVERVTTPKTDGSGEYVWGYLVCLPDQALSAAEVSVAAIEKLLDGWGVSNEEAGVPLPAEERLRRWGGSIRGERQVKRALPTQVVSGINFAPSPGRGLSIEQGKIYAVAGWTDHCCPIVVDAEGALRILDLYEPASVLVKGEA